MLSDQESLGLKIILESLNDDDLFSLLETVTRHMFITDIRHVAIDRILSCSPKPTDLLKRQKVSKKTLFNYLISRGLVISADCGKSELVKKCLKLWGSIHNNDYRSEVNEEICKPSEMGVSSEMGVQFSLWFFGSLNNLNEFGPQHFWHNSTLWAQLQTPTDLKEMHITGANDVASFLSKLIIYDKFYFNANDSKKSILLEEEQHGLWKIMISGVLHQHSDCIGLFDSAFGLVKDPHCENNYKIQLVKLKMRVNISSQKMLPTG